MGYEGNEYAVYQTVIVLAHGDNLYLMTDDREEAVEEARSWLAEELGGTDDAYESVAELTADEIADKILDYDHVAFCDVANRVVLYR